MTKIALIYPSKLSSEYGMSLGIGYLASFVSQNNDVDVKVIDTGVSTDKELGKFIQNEYDAVGFSITSRTYREAVEISRRFRQSHPDVPIIFGGPHVSIMMQDILKDPVIDLAVYGEGEITLNEIIKLLKKEKSLTNVEALSKIEGVIFRNSDDVVVNPPRPLISDLDTLPFPAHHLFPLKRYEGKISMITSRGCPFSCSFCASSQIWGRKWRPRSPKNIIEEINYIVKEFGVYPIYFHDDSFNIDPKRVDALCDEFLNNKVKVPWGVRGVRADKLTEHMVKKMRRAGCMHLAIGVESANPQILERIGKKETLEEITTGINILRSVGIKVTGQFMIGNPGETLETVQESIDFAKKNLVKAFFGTAVPYPKTGLWKYAEKYGRFLVEPDCTTFENTYPRIIFETPEFTAEQRLQAIQMVKKAGYPCAGHHKEGKSYLRLIRNRIIYRYLFQFMPSKIANVIYSFLQHMSGHKKSSN